MEEINIKDYFIYLRRYILAMFIVCGIAIGAVVAYDLNVKKPVYQAQSSVVIAKADSEDGTAATLNEINASQKLANTYSVIAKSELVLNQVIYDLMLGTNYKELSKNVTIKPIEDTSILSITVKDYNPEMAATIANEIAKVFAQQVSTIYNIRNVTQLNVAVAPDKPSNNTFTRDLILAIAISIIGVAGFAFLRFYLDDTVKHNDETEKTIKLPTIGNVVKYDVKSKKIGSELIVDKSPKAIVSENIKSLRTNLQFSAVDKVLKTVLVTSTNAGEGKSFISSNLAISFAQTDKRVLIVDCDLRKGRLHKIFGLPNTSGLSNILTSDLRGVDKSIKPTQIKNLDVITCGTYPPNPSELLASRKNQHLLKILCEHYDIVIFDGAPIGGLTDSVILSNLMDETIMVVKDSSTNRNDLILAREALDKAGAHVAGVVFNQVNRKTSKYYNYNYYYYGDSEQK